MKKSASENLHKRDWTSNLRLMRQGRVVYCQCLQGGRLLSTFIMPEHTLEDGVVETLLTFKTLGEMVDYVAGFEPLPVTS
jgi:hypothetical protein